MSIKRFVGKIALVTGSSSGIGLATACELAAEGATVVANGRDPGRLAGALDTIRTHGAGAHAIAADVTDGEALRGLVSETLDRCGRIDVLVNAVGGGSEARTLGAIDDTDWRRTLDLNLTSVFSACRLVVPAMRRHGYGRIVSVSSVAGRHKGRLSGPQYSAAKAGVQGLTRHLAWDLAADGITVNAVAPGFVDTERARRKWESRSAIEREQMLAQVPLRRFAEPREVARAILFLASDDASYITGVTLDVNGGSYMS